jgi:hypothetical protein
VQSREVPNLVGDFIVRRIAAFELSSDGAVRQAFRRRDDDGLRPPGFHRVRRDVSVVIGLLLVVPGGLLLQHVGAPSKGIYWPEAAFIGVLLVPIFYYGVRTLFERQLAFAA